MALKELVADVAKVVDAAVKELDDRITNHPDMLGLKDGLDAMLVGVSDRQHFFYSFFCYAAEPRGSGIRLGRNLTPSKQTPFRSALATQHPRPCRVVRY